MQTAALKAAREQDEARWAEHYAAQFRRAVTLGDDLQLPVYSLIGKSRTVPVSGFLGEPHKAARDLLFRACAAAARGDATMAAELLTSFTTEVAQEYGVTTAETVSLMTDPDNEHQRRPVVVTPEQCADMDETFGYAHKVAA